MLYPNFQSRFNHLWFVSRLPQYCRLCRFHCIYSGKVKDAIIRQKYAVGKECILPSCHGGTSSGRVRVLNDKSVRVRARVGRALDGPGLPSGCIIRSNLARLFLQRWWKEGPGNPQSGKTSGQRLPMNNSGYEMSKTNCAFHLFALIRQSPMLD